MLIAVALASVLAYIFHLPIETIGTRFGGVPALLPAPQVPQLALLSHPDIWMAAVSFTLLGGVESLLSAKVADGMTGRKHRSNMELVAQGIANMASALFGGISVTGTIARTATNIRAGARSPMSGMLHAMFVLTFMAVAAPLASYVPLSALAGVLVVVCWNMAEKREAAVLLRAWRPGSVMAVTFLVTLIDNLTVGIIAGCVLAAIYALWSRWREAAEV
jgi:SulP family sulfate permease